MSRVFPFLLLISGLCAQTPGDSVENAPPDVDAALRERISRFFEAHVDRKLLRQAEQYVAEDTKDFFFESNKPTYLAFEIDKIYYSDHFTKAKAIVKCKRILTMRGFANTPVTMPVPSTWKIENGQWVWFVDQTIGRETPFGRMKPSQPAAPGASVPSLSSGPDIQTLWKNVQADKRAVQLSSSKESSGEVTISSKMPGISLRLDYTKVPGLEVELDRTELKEGEQAKLSLRFQPQKTPAPNAIEVRVIVQPTNQLIPIAVSFQ